MLQEISNNLTTPTDSPARKYTPGGIEEFSKPAVKSMSRVFGSSENKEFENLGDGFDQFLDNGIDVVSRELTFPDI